MQLTATQLSKEYGFTPRHWARLAASGKVPGARQPAGPNGQWMFDPVAFKRWWDSREREVESWPGYTKEVKRGMRVPSATVLSSEPASRQRTELLLRNALGNGSTSS